MVGFVLLFLGYLAGRKLQHKRRPQIWAGVFLCRFSFSVSVLLTVSFRHLVDVSSCGITPT